MLPSSRKTRTESPSKIIFQKTISYTRIEELLAASKDRSITLIPSDGIAIDPLPSSQSESPSSPQRPRPLRRSLYEEWRQRDPNAPWYSPVAQSSLEMNQFLEKDLRGNEIGDRGVLALSRALSLGIDLERLDLRDNHIGDDGADSLAWAISYTHTCYTLTDLNLSGNHIGDIGAERLANALKLNSTLNGLNLSGNSIGDDGAEAFLDAMEYNSAIAHLNLSRNSASREVREDIAKILEANRAGKRRARTLGNTEANRNAVGNGIGGRRGQRVSKSLPHRRPRGLFAMLRYAIACG